MKYLYWSIVISLGVIDRSLFCRNWNLASFFFKKYIRWPWLIFFFFGISIILTCFNISSSTIVYIMQTWLTLTLIFHFFKVVVSSDGLTSVCASYTTSHKSWPWRYNFPECWLGFVILSVKMHLDSSNNLKISHH